MSTGALDSLLLLFSLLLLLLDDGRLRRLTEGDREVDGDGDLDTRLLWRRKRAGDRDLEDEDVMERVGERPRLLSRPRFRPPGTYESASRRAGGAR